MSVRGTSGEHPVNLNLSLALVDVKLVKSFHQGYMKIKSQKFFDKCLKLMDSKLVKHEFEALKV